MQQIYEFIRIEGSISSGDIHEKILEIAIKNIQDLNVRWGNSKDIIYKADKLRFEPSDYTDASNYNVVDLLNKYINWDTKTGKERNFYLKTYLRFIHNKFDELNTELHYRQLTNGLNNEEIQTIEDFIHNYRSFSPIGFLSKEEENQIQSKCDYYCDELENNFLSIEKQKTSQHQTIPHHKNSIEKNGNTSFSISQIMDKYLRSKSKDVSLWNKLIGQ